jgi:hypothetical protein
MLLDIYHILTVFFLLENMFKFIILLLIVQQVFSADDQVISISDHPLFTRLLGIIDQLLVQVRKMQTLINRTYDMVDRIPDDLRPYFAECFTATHNTSRIEYSLNLSEVEITRIPQMKDQLNQAKTLEEQLSIMNITERIVADITFNIFKPSLSFVTEILDCFKSKSQLTIA